MLPPAPPTFRDNKGKQSCFQRVVEEEHREERKDSNLVQNLQDSVFAILKQAILGADCAAGCRWSTARGTVRIVGDTATVDATINTCDGGTETTRATLERASNGRNVLYWTPANVSTKWVRNA